MNSPGFHHPSQSQEGWTAAMRAAQYGHGSILRYFLDTGASKEGPNLES